jgi:adenylate cyclase
MSRAGAELIEPSGVVTDEVAAGSEMSRITDWLIAQGLRQADMGSVLEGFCQRLIGLGVPLWRGYVSARTLHPRIIATGYAWRAADGISRDEYDHYRTPPQAYLDSPFAFMEREGLEQLRVRLGQPEAERFPLLREFGAAGATDYIAHMVGFGEPSHLYRTIGVVASWTSRAPAGFSTRDVGIIDHLMPRLALALGARLGREIAINLLDTYLGPEAGHRVLQGEIRRGSLEVISAAILYADFRGFTAITDRRERDLLIDMLNEYFDRLVPIVHKHGGQVLKFLGDGLLATFAIDDHTEMEVCDQALEAGAEAISCTRELSIERLGRGLPAMDLDIALHLGDVFYGNVGSVERLDFTVIGPAVNEASRIEALCSQHDRALLISQAFAAAIDRAPDRLVAIGRFALRGVRSAQTIYTLADL